MNTQVADPALLVRQARIDLAALHRIAAGLGWSESVVNHMTFMPPGLEDRFLVIRYGTHWAEATAGSFLMVDLDGKVLEGEGEAEMSAIAIHAPIHRLCPQARCILHTHQPSITPLTAIKGARIEMVHQDAALFHGITNYDEAYGDVPTGASVGEALAKELGSAQVLMMASHGPLIASETIARAFALLYYLDRICALQVKAMQTGLPLQTLTPDQAAKMAPLLQSIYLGREAELHFNARKRLLDRAGEDYAS